MPLSPVNEAYIGGDRLGPLGRVAVMDALHDRYTRGDVEITPYTTGIFRGGVRVRSTDPTINLNNPVLIGQREIGSSNIGPTKYTEQSGAATFGWRVASVVYKMFLVW